MHGYGFVCLFLHEEIINLLLDMFFFSFSYRCAMSCAANFLKSIYVKRTPEANKTIHIYSSALKATLTWHNMRTLQVTYTLARKLPISAIIFFLIQDMIFCFRSAAKPVGDRA